MRRQISSKSSTCPEGMDVYAAGISVTVGVSYPGRSGGLPRATGAERLWEGSPEVSRGHSRLADQAEGLNVVNGVERLRFRWPSKAQKTAMRSAVPAWPVGDGISEMAIGVRQAARQAGQQSIRSRCS